MVSNKKRFYSEYKLDNTDQRRGAKPGMFKIIKKKDSIFQLYTEYER